MTRIGTRGSRLALAQTQWVAEALREYVPGLKLDVQVITTTGDKVRDRPLAGLGGTGVFTRELDVALLDGRVDLAVHSLKDVPTAMPEGITLAATPIREDPRDAFISRDGALLAELTAGARVGTGSLRRRAQLLATRPDLKVSELRGNVETRLRKLQTAQHLSGIILALAGVRRLGLDEAVTEILDIEAWLPAPGQGALAVSSRAEDDAARELAARIDDPATRASVTAERAFMSRLEGGCHAPVGAYGRVENGQLVLDGLVAALDGGRVIRDGASGPVEDAASLGTALAERLLAAGGAEILTEIAEK